MSGENNGEHIPLERISRKRSSKEEEGGQQDTKQQRFSVPETPTRPKDGRKRSLFNDNDNKETMGRDSLRKTDMKMSLERKSKEKSKNLRTTKNFKQEYKNEYVQGFEPNPITLRKDPEMFSDSRSSAFLRITPSTLIDLMQSGNFTEQYIVIDCRYPFEYSGGHLLNAINEYDTQKIGNLFFDSNGTPQHQKIPIFYCEFSEKRAPSMANSLRRLDRALNNYPRVSFSQLLVVDKGYCGLFKSYSTEFEAFFVPNSYISMNDESHSKELSEFHAHRRRIPNSLMRIRPEYTSNFDPSKEEEKVTVGDSKESGVKSPRRSIGMVQRERDVLHRIKVNFDEALRTFDTNDGVTAFSTLANLIAEISPADGSGKNPNPINDFEKSIEEFMKMMTDLKVSYDRKTGRQEKLNEVNKEYKKFMEGANEEVMLGEADLEKKKRKLTNELKEAYREYFGSIVETKEKVFGLHDQFHENLHIFLTVDEHSSPPLEQDGPKEEREKEMKEAEKRPRKPERSIQYDDLTML
ncbi:unnamed protein product [Caenorhabditis brenneri]